MIKNRFYRVRLIDEVSSKRYVVEVKDSWFKPWRSEHSASYKFGNKLDIRQQMLTYIDEIMEDSVVLYDSRKG